MLTSPTAIAWTTALWVVPEMGIVDSAGPVRRGCRYWRRPCASKRNNTSWNQDLITKFICIRDIVSDVDLAYMQFVLLPPRWKMHERCSRTRLYPLEKMKRIPCNHEKVLVSGTSPGHCSASRPLALRVWRWRNGCCVAAWDDKMLTENCKKIC